MATRKLNADEVYLHCTASGQPSTDAGDSTAADALIGQERAIAALELGAAIERDGYNLFVLGQQGTGRHGAVRRFLEAQAIQRPAAPDWCYVHNFEDARKPRILAVSPRTGVALQKDMANLVEELQSALTAALEGEEYQTRLQLLEEELKETQSNAFAEIQDEAQQQGFRLIQGPMGVMLVPVNDGKPVGPEDIQKLPPEEQKALEERASRLQSEMQRALRQAPRWQREHREKVRELNRQATHMAVGALIEELEHRYAEEPSIVNYLEAVERDVVEHARTLVQSASEDPSNPVQAMLQQHAADPGFLRRYQVNVIAHNGDKPGAPVVHEEHPTYANLIGRTEHIAQFGALVTDFNLIRAGALHRANGGYLILDAIEVLQQPYAWDGLKRALRSRELKIESLSEALGFVQTVSIEPEPVPLDIKVALVGEPLVYYLLCERDPDFAELFKVAADFDDTMARTPDTEAAFVRLVAGMIRDRKLPYFEPAALARTVEHAARLAGDAEKLALNLDRVGDVLTESAHWARAANADTVQREHVVRAIEQQNYRAGRIRERIHGEITRGTLQIDTQGEVVGQINGLSVSQLGGFAFGRPSRLTASARLGSAGVIDIEREVKLSGPLHAKGVLILSGLLGERYARDFPLSLSASLVFEQSYGGVDGDSASLAEFLALTSAIAGVPLKQSFAVTGSINQHGRVQAIGGANEKIEGFFDVCAARGLTGEQGVVLPASNVVHLMLRDDVTDAVRDGRFQIHTVETVDDGIELLTRMAAGTADEDGRFDEASYNGRVQAQLRAFAETVLEHAGTKRDEGAGS